MNTGRSPRGQSPGNAPLNDVHRGSYGSDLDSAFQLRRLSVSALDISRHGHANMPSTSVPFWNRLLTLPYAVLNANTSTHDLSSTTVLQFEDRDLEAGADTVPISRIGILSALRPEKLIGSYQTVADWMSRKRDDPQKNKKLKKFYEEQNSLIDRYAEIDHLLDYGKIHFHMLSEYTQSKLAPVREVEETDAALSSEPMDQTGSKSRLNELPGNIGEGGRFLGYDAEESGREVVLAILVNFFINFLLLVGKVVISLMTSSLSVVASLVDSVLDFLSTFIIYVANRLSNTKNWRTQIMYPIGRAKLEPLGILIFSVIIIISFLQVGLESTKKLLLTSPAERIPVSIGRDAISIMVVTVLAKVGCWWWCSVSKSSSVQALAQDAMTDIIFNSVSLVMPVVGHVTGIWWFDPAGALALSIYVVVSWSATAFEHLDNLTGAVAPIADYKVILYLAYRFAEPIKLITALKVYHVGDMLNVEIDVVFDTEGFNLSFRDAHDIAEALQYAIETLPMVERAFVHIDYMEGNFKGHLN